MATYTLCGTELLMDWKNRGRQIFYNIENSWMLKATTKMLYNAYVYANKLIAVLTEEYALAVNVLFILLRTCLSIIFNNRKIFRWILLLHIAKIVKPTFSLGCMFKTFRNIYFSVGFSDLSSFQLFCEANLEPPNKIIQIYILNFKKIAVKLFS